MPAVSSAFSGLDVNGPAEGEKGARPFGGFLRPEELTRTTHVFAIEKDNLARPLLGAPPDSVGAAGPIILLTRRGRRALFSLGRLAGLRVPSETHILTWADIDWERGRLSVYAPKTERYPQHRRRERPMVSALQAVLAEALDAASEGQERVVVRSRNNMHRDLAIIIRRAGVESFPRVWQTLRPSCATKWSLKFPQHAVSAWLGHSEQVSRTHYLTIPDELWESAAKCAADNGSQRVTVPDKGQSVGREAPDVQEENNYKN